MTRNIISIANEDQVIDTATGDITAETHADAQELVGEIREGLEANARLIDIAFGLENLACELRKNPDFAKCPQMAIATEMMFTGDHAPAGFSLENISLEAVENTKEGLIAQIMSNIKQSAQKQLDFIHYLSTGYNEEQLVIKKLNRLISKMGDKDEATVKTWMSKYMCCGQHNKPVDSMDEYVHEFDKVVDTMVPFMSAAKELADDSLFQGWKLLTGYLTGKSDDVFDDRFEAIERATNDAKKSKTMKEIESKYAYQTYGTELMLGQAQAIVMVPTPGSYDKKDQKSVASVLRYFYMYIYRTDKFKVSSMVAGNKTFTINGKQCRQLLKRSEELLKATDGLLSMTTRTATAYSQSGGSYGLQARFPNGDADAWVFLKNVRLVNRVTAMIYESVSSSFNFSVGNVEKANKIVESALKRYS